MLKFSVSRFPFIWLLIYKVEPKNSYKGSLSMSQRRVFQDDGIESLAQKRRDKFLGRLKKQRDERQLLSKLNT